MHVTWEEFAKEILGKGSKYGCVSLKQDPPKAMKDLTTSLKFLKVFGCLYFTHVPQSKHDKLDKRASPSIFIGYNIINKAYKIFQPQTWNIIGSRDAHFKEDEEWNWDQPMTELKLKFPALSTE